MLITTTPGIEGRPVTEYLGIVTAQQPVMPAATPLSTVSLPEALSRVSLPTIWAVGRASVPAGRMRVIRLGKRAA